MADDHTMYDDFWAAFFGLEVARFREAGVHVVRHAYLGDYSGVWFFVRQSCVVVSAPDSLFDRLGSKAERIRAEPLPGPELVRELLGRPPERVIGPVYQGSLARGAFRPVHDANVRCLNAADDPELHALGAACAPEEWEHSGLGSASDPRYGYFDHGGLIAVAGTAPRTASAINPGVLVHPERRGHGYGRAVVSAVVENALASGKLPLYQTLIGNAGSMALAERLGYQQYATHVAVRASERI